MRTRRFLRGLVSSIPRPPRALVVVLIVICVVLGIISLTLWAIS